MLPATMVTAATLCRFFTFLTLLACGAAAIATARHEERGRRLQVAPSGRHTPDGMNLRPEGHDRLVLPLMRCRPPPPVQVPMPCRTAHRAAWVRSDRSSF